MKAKCLICDKEFEKYNVPKKHRRNSIRRCARALTCSMKCSKKYMQIYRVIKYRINKE